MQVFRCWHYLCTDRDNIELNSYLYLYTNNVKVYEISTSKYLQIVLGILFSVYNLMMANWGPKHVVVSNFSTYAIY